MNVQGRFESVARQNLQYFENPRRTQPSNSPHIPEAMHHFANYLRPQTPLYNMWGNDNNATENASISVVRTENQIISTRVHQNIPHRPFQYYNTSPHRHTLPIFNPTHAMSLNMQMIYHRNFDLQCMLKQQQNYIVLQQEVMALQQQVNALKLRSVHQPTPVRFVPIEQTSSELRTEHHVRKVEEESGSADLDLCMGLQEDDEDDDSHDFPVSNNTDVKKVNTRTEDVLQNQPIKKETNFGRAEKKSTVYYTTKQYSNTQSVSVNQWKNKKGRNSRRRQRQNLRNCQVCQLKYNSEQNPVSSQSANGPLNQLAIHLIGPIKTSNEKKKIVYVFKDIYSNWVEFHPKISKDSKVICYVLDTHFKIHGAPEAILVEDEAFQSSPVEKLLEDWNVKLLHISEVKTYESKNQMRVLKDFLEDKDWEENIKILQHSINTTPRETTGITPAELFLGQRKTRKMLNRCETCSSDPSTYEYANEHTQKQILNVHKFLKNHDIKSQDDCADSEEDIPEYDLSYDINYKPDDLVLAWSFDYTHNSEGKWNGPYKVLTMIDSSLVKLQNTKYPFGIIQRTKIQIKPYTEEQDDSVPIHGVLNKIKAKVSTHGKKSRQDVKQYKSITFRPSKSEIK